MPKDDYSDEWAFETPHAGLPLHELFEEFQNIGLGPPDTWASYHVDIDRSGHVEATITDRDGISYSLDADVTDFEDYDQWDWVWDIWDWLETEYDDFDLDVKYSEP